MKEHSKQAQYTYKHVFVFIIISPLEQVTGILKSFQGTFERVP